MEESFRGKRIKENLKKLLGGVYYHFKRTYINITLHILEKITNIFAGSLVLFHIILHVRPMKN